jgi:ATP-binding cassette subfamily B protein
MMAMGWVTSLIQRGSASMRRINRILEEVPEVKDSAHSRHVSRIRGKVEINGLDIRHPGQANHALKGIRLKMDAGETVALVGRVGAGKTTLLHTIPRLLDVPPGTVFIDGQDVLEIPLKTLRDNIGFVTQEVFVFSDTIRNNVLFGRRDVSERELEAVLRAADISEDIQALEKGLDTILGERGVTLSGGQRQRVTIARALISDPPILIMDDALSMVDTRTEERILNQILQLRHNKTNLITSHRISTISRANRIVVLERGKIVEQGSHSKLIELGGIYAALYERQQLVNELGIGVE